MIKYFLIPLLVFAHSFCALAQTKTSWKKANRDELRGALRPERTCFDVTYYDLHLKINPRKRRIDGHNAIHFKVVQPTQTIQIDLSKLLKIEKIVWKNTELKYKRRRGAVFVFFDTPLPQNSLQSIEVYYGGRPLNRAMPGNKRYKGLYWERDINRNPWVGVSCEHVGANVWWPNKDHLSDEPDSMRMHFTVPKRLKCIANGTLEKVDAPQDKYQTYHWFVNNPIDNYNVTFYLGDYYEGVLPYGKHKIYYYCLTGGKQRAKQYFSFTPYILSFFEAAFGEYPFWNDKFAILQSPYTGMEHQSCLAIGSRLGSTNWYYVGKYPWHSTLVHEIAHEWWGNSVSVDDMAEVWLQEGFATYAELMFIESQKNYAAYLTEVHEQTKRVLNREPIVGKRDVNYNTFKTNLVYRKGAVILHLLRSTINNDPMFFDILKSFAIAHKKKIVRSSDFVAWVNKKTGKDYTAFFQHWLYTTKLPVLAYKKEKLNNNKIKFTYWWIGVPQGFRMMAYIQYGKRTIPIQTTTSPQSVKLNKDTRLKVSLKGLIKGKAVIYYDTQKQ